MISPEEAAKLVLNKTGYKSLYFVKDYDDKHYVVCAAPDDEKLYLTDNTFGVDKNTGVVSNFSVNSQTVEAYQKANIVYK